MAAIVRLTPLVSYKGGFRGDVKTAGRPAEYCVFSGNSDEQNEPTENRRAILERYSSQFRNNTTRVDIRDRRARTINDRPRTESQSSENRESGS